MSYEVFALKYRPQTFADVVGQQSVAQTLARGVQTARIANAYLFCGSRGVGKTSMARILAKALNCPAVKEGEPCNRCEVCTSISLGEEIDVIEIDGASNRGIEDIRDIRDNAGYVPSRSPYKIYIIDEVHMLTIPAFNALLKVLEEPPPHVKFIFATTDPNNLPDTILSRCQRHEFRRISEDDIVGRLAIICEREGVEVDGDVLRAIATKAEGGLRDSVSLLDQVVSFAGDRIRMTDLEGAIGLLPRERLEQLVRAIVAGEAGDVVAALADVYWSGVDPQDLVQELIGWFRQLMIYQASPASVPDGASLEQVARDVPADRVFYILRLLLNVGKEMRRSGHERVQLELTCLKAARSTALLPIEEIMARLEGHLPPPSSPPPAARSAAPTPVRRTAAPAQDIPPRPAPPAATADPIPAAPRPTAQPVEPGSPSAGGPPSIESVRRSWTAVCQAVREASAPLAVALARATPERIEGRKIVISLPPDSRFLFEQLAGPVGQQTLAAALRESLGADLTPSIVLAEGGATNSGASKASKTVYDDPSVRKFLEHFDGGVSNVENSDG